MMTFASTVGPWRWCVWTIRKAIPYSLSLYDRNCSKWFNKWRKNKWEGEVFLIGHMSLSTGWFSLYNKGSRIALSPFSSEQLSVSSAGGIEGWELGLCHIGYSGHPELSLEMGILEDTVNTTQDGHHWSSHFVLTPSVIQLSLEYGYICMYMGWHSLN